MASVRTAQILAHVVASQVPPELLCRRLVDACAEELPVTGVGIVLMTDSGPAGVVAVTDGPAATMEELQFTLGEGPCVDSSRTGRPVLQPDLALTGPARWPGFSAGALEAGICAIFALPLRVGGIRLGVLDLYRDEPGPLGEKDLMEALHYADAATSVLLHLQSLAQVDGLGALPVLEDRAEVHQATGVVSVQAGVALPHALALLRARAFAEERPVLELARAVLRHEVSFDEGVDGR
jgi:GAF domain-containing protein